MAHANSSQLIMAACVAALRWAVSLGWWEGVLGSISDVFHGLRNSVYWALITELPRVDIRAQ
jgi:hypothetical protein